MFLLLLAPIPLTALWLARPIFRHCNLQTLVVAPTVILLLLMPLFFPSSAKPNATSRSLPESSYRYSTNNQPISPFSR